MKLLLMSFFLLNGGTEDRIWFGGQFDGLSIVLGSEFEDPATKEMKRWVVITGKMGGPFPHQPIVPQVVEVDADGLSFCVDVFLAGYDEDWCGAPYRLCIEALPEHWEDGDSSDDAVGWVKGYSPELGNGRHPLHL